MEENKELELKEKEFKHRSEADTKKAKLDKIRLLSDVMTETLPLPSNGFGNGGDTIWVPAMSEENREEIQDKIMQLIREL